MNSRGISGKWNAMWHSSPSPKYATASSGHWLASASSMRSGNSASMCVRSSSQVRVRLGQVLAVGALALVEVRHGVQAQPVDAHLEPEVDDAEHRRADVGVVEVEVGLVASRSGARSTRPATGSQVQLDGSKSWKMMRTSGYSSGVSLHT